MILYSLIKRLLCQLLTLQSLLIAILFSSCANIPVDRGPFEIERSADELQEKKDFLESLESLPRENDRPNVLLILVDDLGKHDISLFDEKGIESPHINDLARRGVVFSSAYATSSVCSPSRAGLFTGRYPQRFGFERQPMNRYSKNRIEYFIVDQFMDVEPMRLISPMAVVPRENILNQGIPPEEILLSELMQHAGYKTAIFGKWHLGQENSFKPNHRGFDYHYGFYEAFTLYSPLGSKGILEYHHDYFANKHIWRQERKESCAIRVNDSIILEEEYLTFAIANRASAYMEAHKDEPFFMVTAFNAPHTPFQVPQAYYDLFEDIEDENKRIYAAMIKALDDGIGKLVNSLDSLGLLENTIILFASDNGGATYTEATDNGPLKAGKFSQFEGGLNIPMFLCWEKEIKGGGSYEKAVSLLDVFPTIASACNISVLQKRVIDGVSLLPSCIDQDEEMHDYLYWRTDFNKAIRSRDWKLIWNTRDEQEFLYDLRRNNYEQKNVAAMYPDIIKDLKEAYAEWEAEMAPPLWPGVMEFKFDIDGEISWWAI